MRERSGSRAQRFASATGREIKAMWRAGGDAAALTRTTRRSGGGARGQSPPANVHERPIKVPELTCSPVDLSWPGVYSTVPTAAQPTAERTSGVGRILDSDWRV